VETIRLAEALERMETAEVPFTLRFVKYDKRRKTGGQVVEWANCRLSRPRRPRTMRQLAEQAAGQAARTGGAQRHYRNSTRNLVVGNSTQRRKVHIWLLLALNGVKIVL
jgi:hypothetical protein